MKMKKIPLALCALSILAPSNACSLRRMAVNSLGDALARGSASYARDGDPELVGQAVPFGLKTIEALLDETPRHKDLLLAAASGFAQYAYGFVQQEADFIEARDLSRATDLRARAKRLYLRGRDYGLRGLEVSLPGFRAELRKDRTTALTRARKAHVPLLYWTALAWFGAINLAKNEAELTADQDLAEALMRRALALDEAYERGVIHDFFIAWEARGPSVGGSFTRAKTHLDRALALSQGRRARPLVAYAEAAAVGEQNRQSFEETLARALAVDPEADPEQRLVNVLIQKRARWLRGRADELFIE